MAAGKFSMNKASGGVASITVADGVGATNIVLPESGTVATTSNIVGFKNHIINGGFDVWQRGTSFIATTAFAYMADRFRIKTTSGTCSVIKNPNGMPTKYTQSLSKTNYITISSNNNGEIEMSQPIEDVRTLAGKNVTVSFNAAIFQGSEKNINICIMQFFGTGGSAPVVTNIKTISVKANVGATAVDRYNATFNLPSIAGKTITSDSQLVLIVRIPNGSYSFDIGQVQLEEGSVATPFENRPIGLELSLCQRYYEVLGAGIGQAKDAYSMILHFSSSEKRVPATAILLNTSPYAESPINITARNGVSSGINLQMNQINSKSNGYILNITGFSSMTAGQSASINAGVIALSAEL